MEPRPDNTVWAYVGDIADDDLPGLLALDWRYRLGLAAYGLSLLGGVATGWLYGGTVMDWLVTLLSQALFLPASWVLTIAAVLGGCALLVGAALAGITFLLLAVDPCIGRAVARWLDNAFTMER